jgi:hypothetical protein
MTCRALTAAAIFLAFAFRAGGALAQDAVKVVEVVEIEESPAVVPATPLADGIAAEAARLALEPQDTPARPVAIEYSDGHLMRAKIHKYASFATLPLIAGEFALGESLYNDPNSGTSSNRGLHGAVGAGLISLFGLNSVTGMWNLLESRQAPGHTKRLVHGLLMLASEGGFVAAAVTAPGHGRNDVVTIDANRATHRNIAIVSMGVGTAGYLLMLLTHGGQ